MSIDDLARSAAQDLRATAAGTFDVDGGLERIPASSRRRTITQQGTALAMLVLVLFVGALVVRPHLGAAPEPVDSGTPTPSVSHPTTAPTAGPTPVPSPTGPFEALVVRGTTLVAIDAQGHERYVRDLASLKIPAADLQFAWISTTGRLAIVPGGRANNAGTGHEFLDLLDPTATPVLVRGLFDNRAWSPDGIHFATLGKGTVIIDSTTGVQTTLDEHGQGLPRGGPSIIWTADGTGIVVATRTRVPGWTSAQLFVAPVDGGPLRTTIPDLWPSGAITVGGLQLDYENCFFPTCPAGLVRVLAPSGTTTTLYSGDLPGAKLADATLSRDGRSAFLLVGSGATNQLEVARSDAGRRPSVLATVPVVTTAGASIGISPDDGTALVETITNPNAPEPTINSYVVPLDGTPARDAKGSFAGWVPSGVVDAIAAAR